MKLVHGVYTCSTHEFSLSIDISVGKCTEIYIGELALSILEIYVVPYVEWTLCTLHGLPSPDKILHHNSLPPAGNPSVIAGYPYLYVERGPQIPGQSLTLSCFVSGTFDRGAWSRRDGTDISSLPGTIISGHVVIFFTSITLRHAGEYIYTVTKGIRRISAIFAP